MIASCAMVSEGNPIDVADLPEWVQHRNMGIKDDETQMTIEEVDCRHAKRVLESVGGNQSRAAEVLGIGRTTLYRLLLRESARKQSDEPPAKAKSAG